MLVSYQFIKKSLEFGLNDMQLSLFNILFIIHFIY
jgi:hypothetical protein